MIDEKIVKKIKNMSIVKDLSKEFKFLEYYLFESPWKYEGEGKSLKPTLDKMKKLCNEIIFLIVERELIIKNHNI